MSGPSRALAASVLLAASALLGAVDVAPAAAWAVPVRGQAAGSSGPLRAGDEVDLPLPEREPSQVRSAARRVLDRPEFRRPAPSITQRVWSWVVERIERALGALLGGGRAAALAWLVLAAAVAVAVFFAIRFARGVTPEAAQRGQRAVVRRRSPQEWRAEADAHARDGRWRDAVRCRYRALVADLETRGLLDDVPGRTAGEYRRDVAASAPGAAAAFSEASEVFEVAWYGHGPTGDEQDAALRRLSDRVMTEAG